MFRGLLSLVGLAAIGSLYFTNPALPDFEKNLKGKLSDDKSAVEEGFDFLRKGIGLTSLKQATGIKHHEICRFNLYVGSAFIFRRSSVGSDDQTLALGAGAAGRIWIFDSSESSLINSVVQPLKFRECEGFLAS